MPRKVNNKNRLSVVNLSLAKEWHPTKNGDLTPNDVSFGSNKKVWWYRKECNHEWDAIINARSGGSGCPYCSNHRVCIDNCLATLNPKLAAEWHSTKNGELTPHDVMPNSSKKVWWRKKECDHEWEAVISSRNQGAGCSCCAGRQVCVDNCLATLRPDLAEEWHLDKNECLTPYNVTINSSKKVWWYKKDCKHEWESTVAHRNFSGRGCPYCAGQKVCIDNCLATLRPDLAAEWHSIKNGDLTPYDVTRGSGKKVWWYRKECSHEWEARINKRYNGRGCPLCPQSKSETIMGIVLGEIFSNNIIYENYKNFDWNISFKGNLMTIDRFVEGIRLAIEYDGEQHFVPIEFYGGKVAFKERKELDELKNKLMKEHIQKHAGKETGDVTYFIRFNYKEFDYRTPKNKIKEIVVSKLKKHNVPLPEKQK